MAAERPVVLMTRPRADSQRFVRALKAERCGPFRPVISPLIEIVVTGPLPDMTGVAGVIMTSIQTVRAYVKLGGPKGRRAWCVGSGTARAAQKAGLEPEVPGYNADTLVQGLIDRAAKGPLIHLRGVHGRGAIAKRLSAAGIPTQEAIVYDQQATPLTDEARALLAGSGPVIAPVFSPRSGDLLAETTPKAALLVAAMSEAVANSVSALHIADLRVAARPDSASMIAETCDLVRRAGALVARDGRV